MGIGNITFGGLASGLDTNAIVSSLVQLERRPIQILQGQRTGHQKKLDLVGTFEGLVKKLQEKAHALANGDFFAHELTIGTEGIADFTLESDAQAGSHTLSVSSLAAADRYALSGASTVTDPDAKGLGTGTITFDYNGTSHSVTIAPGADSLNDIRDAINNDDTAGDAVTASVVNVGTSASPDYQLVIAGNDTGADYTIDNLTVDAGIDLQTGTSTAITSASNAIITLDGLTIQRSTNTFSDVLEGVSFKVSRADATAGSPDATTTFTIETDPEGMKEHLQGFVDAYNEVIDFVNEQNAYTEESGTGGELFGDSILTTVRRALQKALFDIPIATVQADTEGYSTLGLVGIDVDKDGRLEIDDAKLAEKIGANLAKFAELFIDPDDDDGDSSTDVENQKGVLVRLDNAIEALLESTTAKDLNGDPILNAKGNPISIAGVFSARRTSIGDLISDINDQIERLEYRVEQFETNLVQRFSRLEQLMTSLQSQSAYLSSGSAFPR